MFIAIHLLSIVAWGQDTALFKQSIEASMERMKYRRANDFEKALVASRKALELQQRSGMHETLYLNRTNIGQDLLSLGRVDEAIGEFHQALIEANGSTAKSVANLWRTLVQAEIAGHRPTQARKELDRFLAAAVPSAPNYFRAQAAMAESDVLLAEDNYGRALDAVKAARVAESGEDFSLEVFGQLMTCVLDSMRTLSYDDALALATRIDREFAGLKFDVTPFARNAIHVRRRLAGEFDLILKDDLAQLEKAREAGSVPAQVETLRAIAADYASANNVTSQIATLEEAAALDATLPKNKFQDRLLVTLGDAYLVAKEISKAQRTFDRIAKDSEMYGDAQLGKAKVFELDEDPDTAKEILEYLLKQNPGNMYALAQLAKLTKKPEYWQQAIQAAVANKIKRGEILYRMEYARLRPPDAMQQLEFAARDAVASKFADAEWRVEFLRGELAAEKSEALRHYGKALEKLETMRSSLSSLQQRQAFQEREEVEQLYRRLVELSPADKAWDFLERSKARTFLDSLGERENRSVIAAQPELISLEKAILHLRFSLSPGNETVLRGAGRDPGLMKAELAKLEATFSLKLEQASLSTAALRSSRPEPLAGIRKLLPPRTVLIEYAFLEKSICAFVVTRDSSREVVWDADIAKLKGKAMRLRAALSSSSGDYAELLAEISQALIEDLIPPDIDRVMIVPAAWMSYLPFHALIVDGAPLMEKYTVSYLPNASSLRYLPAKAQPLRKWFLGALGSQEVEGWDPLPGTLDEVKSISAIYPQASHAFEKEFTHDAALRALGSFDAVHFATHGLLNEHAPAFSALLTSTGRLSLYELQRTKVNASLVVLSACETGLGKLMSGSEMIGLTRAFLEAGAGSVVSSLWKVSDEGSALLMQFFYQNLRAGKAPPQALREAAVALRKKFPHPFYWAPFFYTGAS